MTHPDRERLNEYADGLLAPEDRAAVDAHLAGCAACRALVADIRALNADLAALPKDIEPGRDLRPPVPRHAEPSTRGTSGPERSTPRPWLRAAAAIALLLGAGAAALLVTGGPGTTQDAAPGADVATPAVASAERFVLVEPYERAADALAAELEARGGRLSPETARLVERNLATLDAAISELEAARAASPSDPVLAELLENRHRTRLDVLREAIALLSEA